PNLAAQWHPTKNGDSTPDKIAPKSNKRVWWLCKKGHEWLTSPANRSRGTGCPECSISRGAEATRLKKLKASGSLQQIDPQLAKEWHSKNGHLTADKVSPYSNKKVWWLCPKGHEWVASVADRSTNGACPFCNKKRPSIDYCLETMRPELAKEWHPNKNGILTPSQITVASNKKVWWKCSNGHEWLSSVANRSKGRGCPQCSKRVASSDYSLAKGNEKLAKEWHSSQNSPLTPKDVTPFSHRKVWWTCPKGHDYVASIAKRSIGRGCPYCAGKKAWIKLE
ncbi:MAG: zinc-ribbon domain-containing protein, partial [Candidatus Omnitrophica bacterium]|nr:zinc-ribbon domain-containing protein [Candidatus Omnitrophota bacterium]